MTITVTRPTLDIEITGTIAENDILVTITRDTETVTILDT